MYKISILYFKGLVSLDIKLYAIEAHLEQVRYHVLCNLSANHEVLDLYPWS